MTSTKLITMSHFTQGCIQDFQKSSFMMTSLKGNKNLHHVSNNFLTSRNCDSLILNEYKPKVHNYKQTR